MIILFGLAGSGKGTQGKALSELFGWRWLSVGEVIRQTGDYQEIIERGELIPDEEVTRLMGKQIEKAEAEGFDLILDGFPRDKTQAEWVAANISKKIDGAIILEVPKEELLKRLALRGRNDDKEEKSIKRRFEIFEQNIHSILPILKDKNIPIKYVDGLGPVETITNRLVGVVMELNPDAKFQVNDVNGEEIEKSYGE